MSSCYIVYTNFKFLFKKKKTLTFGIYQDVHIRKYVWNNGLHSRFCRCHNIFIKKKLKIESRSYYNN